MRYWIFTFGQGHTLRNNYVKAFADNAEAARQKMVTVYGQLWAFQYDNEKAAGVWEYNLHEVPFGTVNERRP